MVAQRAVVPPYRADHGGGRTQPTFGGNVSSAQAISWDDHKARSISRSITWNDRKSRRAGAAMIVVLGAVMWAGALSAVLHHAAPVTVIVRAQSGQQDRSAQLVDRLGGRVTSRIGLID